MEENHESGFNVEDFTIPNNTNKDHGWQKVVYPKRQRKTAAKGGDDVKANGGGVGGVKSNVFRSVELHADDRRRRITEAQKANNVEVVPRSRNKHRGSDDDDYESDEEGVENGGDNVEEKKPKVKKIKKPKVTVQEAASKIDASDLAAFLVDVTASYESQQDIQLMRFADYFARAFSNVAASQFPWTKTFKESPIAKIADIPLSYISEDVYKTSVDWINQRSPEALGSFVLWSLDSILADLAAHLQVGSKGSKKAVQQVSSKAQVAIFVVLAMTLRRKPDVLISLLPTLRENPKYQGQDKLPVLVWAATQACHGDLAVGMYAWAYNFLPIVNAKSCNPQSRDLILQLVERILSTPKARPVLLNSAVRKGERMVPPSAFEILMRLTFPASSARVKATERFEAVYPVLKEVALAGSTGSKAMKQVTQQIFSFTLKAVGESAPELSKEAAGICIWSLTQNTDIYKHWDKVYLENVGASAAVLKKLANEWKEHSAKHLSLDPLREALKSFRQKNEEELADGEKSSQHASIREANKYCKVLIGRTSRSHGCLKGMAFVLVAAAAVGAFAMSPDMESWDLEKIKVMFANLGSV
ncbi:hypothetical protein MKW94_012556 [Papaver nudicaule]|uniref:Transmembrane protein 214-A n=1 Tax=Papaver nudicaule TaxID=74823 RepID=A0AA41S3T5_PAPNU|nr:hypothetical protein [Papaver nudicaule]